MALLLPIQLAVEVKICFSCSGFFAGLLFEVTGLCTILLSALQVDFLI